MAWTAGCWFLVFVGLFVVRPTAGVSVSAFMHSSESLVVSTAAACLSVVPSFFSWVNYRDAALLARDAAAAAERKANADAAAAERKANAEAMAARDAAASAERKANADAAAAERKANADALAARDAAAAAERKADMDSLRAIVGAASKVSAHQISSVAAGLRRVGGSEARAPAYGWSAAEVGAWFANSMRWKQYQGHFATYDGVALFELHSEEQLKQVGVLTCHTAALLADLMALV